MVLTYKIDEVTAIDEINFIRMRGRDSVKATKSIGVDSFVESLKNVVWELKLSYGCKNNYVEIQSRSNIALQSYYRNTYLCG